MPSEMQNKRTNEQATQAYAAWAMLSRPTQTGMDIRYHDAPPPTLHTITARPWEASSGPSARFQRGVATQARARRVVAITQTPREGPDSRKRRRCSGRPTMEEGPSGGPVEDSTLGDLDRSWDVVSKDSPEPHQRAGVRPEPDEMELSWDEGDLIGDPMVEIPQLDPYNPLGLVATAEALIEDILLRSPNSQ